MKEDLSGIASTITASSIVGLGGRSSNVKGIALPVIDGSGPSSLAST